MNSLISKSIQEPTINNSVELVLSSKSEVQWYFQNNWNDLLVVVCNYVIVTITTLDLGFTHKQHFQLQKIISSMNFSRRNLQENISQ